MTRNSLSGIEKAVLLLVVIVVAVGFILFFANKALFDPYVVEDGVVEWLTVIGLLLGSFVSFGRVIKFFKKRSWLFLLVNFLLGLMLFLVAGEEISWGQRIFGIQSSAYFQEHNLQGETNFHNLMVGGVKINQVVFSLGLIAVLSIYLIVFPILYRRAAGFKNWIDNWGIVLPQNYQIIAFILLFAITALLPNEKNAELLECGAGWLFFLIVFYPLNSQVFTQSTANQFTSTL